jgi:hypothetical protein
MNEQLIAPYTTEDVEKVMFSIIDLKPPWPDGLHALVYKRLCHLVGNEITVAILKQ